MCTDLLMIRIIIRVHIPVCTHYLIMRIFFYVTAVIDIILYYSFLCRSRGQPCVQLRGQREPLFCAWTTERVSSCALFAVRNDCDKPGGCRTPSMRANLSSPETLSLCLSLSVDRGGATAFSMVQPNEVARLPQHRAQRARNSHQDDTVAAVLCCSRLETAENHYFSCVTQKYV